MLPPRCDLSCLVYGVDEKRRIRQHDCWIWICKTLVAVQCSDPGAVQCDHNNLLVERTIHAPSSIQISWLIHTACEISLFGHLRINIKIQEVYTVYQYLPSGRVLPDFHQETKIVETGSPQNTDRCHRQSRAP